MRENKGTYQNKGTFASCKGSAAGRNIFVYSCNRLLPVSDHLQLFRLPQIISRCYYRYYYVFIIIYNKDTLTYLPWKSL